MNHQRWKTLRSRVLLDRRPWLRIFGDDIELPDGRRVEGYLRMETRDHVVVVPVTSERQLVLLRSYKRGPDAVDLQPPAGMIEAGEDAPAAAERELREETGYVASTWTLLSRAVLGGNLGGGWAHIFLAEACRRVSEPASGDLEAQEVVLFTPSQAQDLWRSGKMLQLGSVAALGLAFDHLRST